MPAIDRERLERWSKKVGWETLLNRTGMTFRKLPDKDKAGINEKKAIALMLAMTAGFFGGAGFLGGILVFLIILVAGIFLLR